MNKAFRMVLSIFLISCSTHTKNEKPKETYQNLDTTIRTNNTTKKYPPLIKQIGQLNEDTCSIHWYGGGLFSLCFERNKVNFYFTAQCVYSYKTKLDGNKIIFFWDYNADCVFDRGLKKRYNVKNKPFASAPFGEFALIDDTTIRVKYYYSEWVKKINENEKDVDTLFPVIFKMKRK